MNPSIQKVKAGGSRVRSQPALHSNTLSQKKQANKQTKKKKTEAESGQGDWISLEEIYSRILRKDSLGQSSFPCYFGV
jgi:hypothetical protein